MKINLELNMPDERVFLNFWDDVNGLDVTCEIKDGKLWLDDVSGSRIISLENFIVRVKKSISEWKKP